MADIKDIVKGTLNSLTDKLREADIPGKLREADIPNKVMEGVKSSAVYDVYEKGTDRVKGYGRAMKMTLEMNGETEELKKVYAEIGKLYYQQEKDNPQDVFVPLFARAEELIDSILAKDDEIKSMKASLDAQYDGDDIDVEICNFEDIVDATENDGSDNND